MLDENWTELKCEDADIPAFLREIENMKEGGSMSCQFCGGTVRMTLDEYGRNVYACNSCDMRISTEAN